MPLRAQRPPPARQQGRPSFVPSTQAGPSRLTGQEDDSEDELALSPIRRPRPPARDSTPATSSTTRSTRVGTTRTLTRQAQAQAQAQAVSSSPRSARSRDDGRTPRAGARSGGARKTRAAVRRDRELEEMGEGDLVPPSEDEEYEHWRESRVQPVHLRDVRGTESSGNHLEGGGGTEAGVRTGLKRPKKPDKDKHFHTLLSSPVNIPFSPTPSLLSSQTDARSRDTSPTQPYSFSQEDPFFPLFDGRRWTRAEEQKDGDVSESAANILEGNDGVAVAVGLEDIVENEQVDRLEDDEIVNGDKGRSNFDDGNLMGHHGGENEEDFRQGSPTGLPHIASGRSSTPETMTVHVEVDFPETGVFDLLAPAAQSIAEKQEKDLSVGDLPRQNGDVNTTPPPSTLPQKTPLSPSMSPLSAQGSQASPTPRLHYPDRTANPRSSPIDVLAASGRSPSPLAQADIAFSPILEYGQSALPLSHPFSSPQPDPNDTTIVQVNSHHPPSSRPSSPPAPLSPMFAAVTEHIPNPSPVRSPEVPTQPVTDPELEQFRTARTFRTRTILQLQPYTKERQIYEAQLRKGGLKKGKKVVAPSKEVTQEDDEEEAQVDDSSDASVHESPERIVIGNTPPAHAQKVRPPKELIEADFDEYFFEHGAVADEADPEAVKVLQQIARRRIRAEKEERRRKRKAEKERRQFESLIREMQRDKDNSPDELALARDKPDKVKQKTQAAKPKSTSVRTPGPKTYGNKNKSRARHVSPASGSDSEHRLPSLPPVPRPPLISPSKSHTGTPTASFRTALSGTGDFDVGYGQPQEPFFAETTDGSPRSPSLRHHASFFIDDMARSPSAQRQSLISSSSSDSDSSSTPAHDPRKKIARRMMPAAMLKRLEAEAAAKERRREEKRRKEHRATMSPMRPGRAVVRRGGGQGVLDDFDSLFSDDQAEIEATPRAASLRPTDSFDRPIVVSDDGDSSSEAAEDNQTEHTLARLHRGDFEGIVAGNRSRPHESRRGATKSHARSNTRSNHPRRPALGLVKRARAPLTEGNRTMVQSRLDFAVMEHSPISPIKSKKRKRPYGTGLGSKTRPAIRLDDHVIFATADFEFDSGDEAPPRAATVKRKHKVSSRPSAGSPSALPPQADPLDIGIGKARSWANFDKFPIDFDISPLPSGLYCDPTSVPGSGRLAALIRFLRGASEDRVIDSVMQYGIELRYDMNPSAVQALVPLLFDSICRQMTVMANEPDQESPDLEPLAFLGRYVAARAEDIDEEATSLKEDISEAIQQIAIKLEDLDVGHSRRTRQARSTLLDIRWSLYELALRAFSGEAGQGMTSVVRDCAVALVRQLLSYGFDRTVRPLKLIMRGESDSPEITDQSITIWISLIHATMTWDVRNGRPAEETFLSSLNQALDSDSRLDQTGPLAAERIWFLIFGLCALSQFDVDGKISSMFITAPRWQLVRRAVGLIKVAFDEDAEKRAHLDQLQGRDRYVKVMMARCVRLSAIWKWSFDRESFSVATRDLGVIFKDRQYRNLPTEPPVDYPNFITRFDMSLTAEEDTKRETAFELYLRLVCVAASDIISAAQTLAEAQQAEKDVQRLVMSIIPVSAIKFNRLFPPSPKELGQLVNRYSTMIAACYFSPSLLSYLLANSKKWSPFEQADFESRQICIRGLMYLAVARRHHSQPLGPVVDRLADIMRVLQSELEVIGGPSAPTLAPNRIEIERTMVLVVTCFRQMIKHHSFDLEAQAKAVYPDPCLLHESWTVRIFDLELARDLKCGLEVVATIQAFLDVRANALPRLARQRREAKESHSESFDEYGSLGIDFTAADVLALGGEVGESDPTEKQDTEFARIIENVISPKIYRLLSDMLPPVSSEDASGKDHDADRQTFISKLTKCWSDCAAVLVVEHQQLDWSTFISPFGRQSWARLGDERGRVQVGLQFMLNVAQLDPAAFVHHEEDFIALLFQVIGTDKLTVEHQYLSSLLLMPGALDHPLLAPLGAVEALERELDEERFMELRRDVLRAIFSSIPNLLGSPRTPASIKSFIYRCVNLFVSSLVLYDNSIHPNRVIHKQSYHAFADTIIRDLRRLAGDHINPMSVPGLKQFKA